MSMSLRYAFGDFVLDAASQRVERVDGSVVSLTPRLFNALLLLVEHAGELLDKDTLLRLLWPGLVVEENNLSQVVSALRRALGDDAQGSRFIQTVPRRGFRFIAKVTRLADEAAPQPPPRRGAAASSDAPPVPSPPTLAAGPLPTDAAAAVGQPASTAVARGSVRRRTLAAGIGLAGALAGLAGAAWRFAGRQPAAVAAGATLAVLPFKPLAPEARDELLEVGMADSLIARLSLVPGLVVRSTGSVRRYGGTDQDPLCAARELDVAWIVDGSLQRRGEQLRATARLLRASDGTAAWSGTFDERFTSVFDMQDTTSARVAQVLAPRLEVDASGHTATAQVGGTRNTDAYQLYLAANRHAQLLRADGLRKTLALYHEALDIDPGYALAWVSLAVTHRRSFIAFDGVPSELFESAGAAVRRALAIAPKLSDALVEQAYRLYWFDYDWPAAEAVFRHAIAINPNVALGHFGLATMLLNQDRVAEGFEQLRLARELDPMSPLINALEADYLLKANWLDAARSRLCRAFDIAPNVWLAHDVQGVLHLAENRPEDAFAAMRRAVALADGSSRASAVLGAYLARHGRAEEARAILKQLAERASSGYVPGTALASVHTGLRETPQALDALERALRDHDPRLVFLKDDPLMADLHQQPRFVALMKRLKLDRFGPGLSPV